MPMVTQLGRVMTKNKKLSLIKLQNTSITWFSDIMYLIKFFVSPLALDQW